MKPKHIHKSNPAFANLDRGSFQKNYENSRILLLSAMVLKVRDKINEIEMHEQMLKPKVDDAFWQQMNAIISRHEAQMDRVTHQAVELRSSLSSSKKTTSTSHTERMAKANSKLKSLQQKISACNQKVEYIKSKALENQEEKVKSEIDSSSTEIEQLKIRIAHLRKNTNDLKTQLQSKKKELDIRTVNLVEKRKEAEAKAANIDESINTLKGKISEVDTELAGLEAREKMCSALYESLRKPIPSIQKIFSSI